MTDFVTSPENACPSRQMLTDFNVGRLSAVDLQSVAAHIRTCAKCVETLATLQRQATNEGLEANLRRIISAPVPAAPSHAQHVDSTFSVSPASSAPAASTLVGAKVGSFAILKEIGHGGMGTVYLAETEAGSGKRRVALKMLNNRLNPTPEMVHRFKTEGDALARLNHPHIVRMYHFDYHEGIPYYTMEYVGSSDAKGRTLAQHLKRGPLSLDGAAELVRMLASAVEYGHTQHVIHRDLKPANILLNPDRTPKISDYGLAKLLDLDTNDPTATDAILGTPAYMSPEQAQGKSKYAFEQADVYALGAILYECLTGRAPFRGATKYEVLHKVVHDKPVPPSEYDARIPLPLEAICLKCLQKKPSQRYASAAELAADLAQWLLTRQSSATPSALAQFYHRTKRLLVPLGLIVGAVLLSGGLHLTDPARTTDNLNRQLKKGLPVTLLTPDAPKLPYRIVSGGDGAKVAVNADGSLTVHSWTKATLIEFFPHVPMNNYRFQATIRHERGDEEGFVGLYVVDQHYLGANSEGHHFFMGLTYNDVQSENEGLMKNLPPPLRVQMKLPMNNRFRMGYGAVGTRQNGVDHMRFPEFTATEFEPRGIAGDQWRTLQLQVTPTTVFGYHNSQLIREYSARDYVKLWQMQQEHLVNSDSSDTHLPTVVPQFQARGGIGFLIRNSSATFKDVVLTPLIAD